MKLNVSDVRASVSQARELVQKLGGYVKRMDDNSAVLAVPVAKADDALAELAAFGVLTSLRIEGEDVTQQVTDLAVRLDNLEKSRKRLLALLEKAEKVEEMIKVEEALTRVTTELERLQAQQKNLQGRIDYVTMNVTFSATVSKTPVRRDATPVAWINRLGENLLAVNRTISYSEEEFIFDLELPAGFVKNGSEGALSGDNCVIELCSRNAAITATHWYGNDYASLDFYRPLIEKALAERFGVPVETDLRSIGGTDGAVFTVRPEIGKTAYFYRIAVAVIRGEVKGIAAFGERENIERSLPESAWNGLLDSVRF